MIDSRYETVDAAGTIVVFDAEVGDLEVVSDGQDDLYFAINPDPGFTMAPEAAGTYWIPAGGLSRVVPTHDADRVVVHLMSATSSVKVALIPMGRSDRA